MSITAVPAVDKNMQSTISERFGRSNYFYLYDEKSGEGSWMESGINDAHGVGTKAVQILAAAGVNQVVAVQLGDNAVTALDKAEIRSFFADKNKTIEQIAVMLRNGEFK